MLYEDIRTTKDMLLYITDCTLATVSSMAMLKSKSKSEYRRQISIAQKSIDFLISNNIPIPENERSRDVVDNFNRSVEKWARHHEKM